MRRSVLITIIMFSFSIVINSQDKYTYELFLKFTDYYNSGDFLKGEQAMLNVLNSTNPPENYIVAAYNNLGFINNRMGKFKEALEYLELAENSISNKLEDSRELADIYINKAFLYINLKSYDIALGYLEKGTDLYLRIKSTDKNLLYRVSLANMNRGLVYYLTKDYENAFKFFDESLKLKLKFNLNDLDLLYLNMAKAYSVTNDTLKADEFFKKSISSFKKVFGDDYHRLAEVYFEYGLFLETINKKVEELKLFHEALSICLKNYGEKHSLTSLSYKHLGDYYIKQKNSDSALFYYQKSLISIAKDFNDSNKFSNPGLDSVILDLRLLENLKGKAKALELMANHQNSADLKIITTKKSLETIELALNVINRMRINYLTLESKMYLVENEKETYLFAIQIAESLYQLTKDKSFLLTMFNIAQKSKAAVLRDEISENELVYMIGIPDSLRIKQTLLSSNISAYEYLVFEEQKVINPDNNKISLWKNAIFELKRESERTKDYINKNYPQYNNLLQKTNPLSVNDIQKQLTDDETIVDYLISRNYIEGLRKMYIFLISKDGLDFCQMGIDSEMVRNSDIILKALKTKSQDATSESFISYTSALFYMYTTLIEPIEGLVRGERLIIIPDEEIGLLPFDAFLKCKPAISNTDFENLQFLVKEYSFSFGYTTSMIFGKEKGIKPSKYIFSFAPDYVGDGNGNNLPGGRNESNAVLKLFSGKEYSGRSASKQNFLEALKTPAIFHLAMHSLTDTSNSKFSYLLFEQDKHSLKSTRLYNYEISLKKINSPMVVLSACNSGSGKLYNGEGILSLARGFILAGASSVIRTKWEINDESSSSIIESFYYYLAKGIPKDESMRLAKLDFIKSNSPYYSNPYFWAGYEVLGSNSQIFSKNKFLFLKIIALVIVISLLIYYFNRRRIISARGR